MYLVLEWLFINWYSMFQIKIIWLLNSLYLDMIRQGKTILIFDACVCCVGILIFLQSCSCRAYVLRGWKNTMKIKWKESFNCCFLLLVCQNKAKIVVATCICNFVWLLIGDEEHAPWSPWLSKTPSSLAPSLFFYGCFYVYHYCLSVFVRKIS